MCRMSGPPRAFQGLVAPDARRLLASRCCARILWSLAAALSMSLLGAAGTAGCTRHLLTGEPLVFGIDAESGAIVDRDVATGGVLVHDGEIITLMVNTVFIKYLEGLGSPHVLVYAEVHDDGTDNPETAFRKVLFNGENTPPGVNLGLGDRILYGPAPFKGFPIRVKFFVVQLRKGRRELASRLINAAGTVGQAVQPEAALAVGVAVQLAQAINALQEDDFELRLDLTLYPVAPAVTWNVRDRFLLALEPVEPSQRQGKMVYLATPLRSGSYIVLKRELTERVGTGLETQEATVVFDHAQEAFLREYVSAEAPAKLVRASEVLRYSGGYLYRIIRRVDTPARQALVYTRQNPNVPTLLVPGIRFMYHDRTYAVLTVLSGMSTGLDAQAMRTASDRDLAVLRGVLTNPDQLPLDARVGPQIERLVASVLAVVQHRRLAVQAGRLASLDPTFRTNPRYPEFWSQNLEDPAGASGSEATHRQAANIAILGTLSAIVVNLPPIRPDDAGAVACLKRLRVVDFSSLTERPGLFVIKDESLTKLAECRQGKPTAGGSSGAGGTAPQR